jgi:diguanylate cyclase (GGDEF)-like protein
VTTPLRAIIVEDSADDAELLVRELTRHGYEVRYERVDDANSLDRALQHGPWDIVLSDHSMPAFGSGAALQMVRRRDPDVPFLIVSGTMGEDVAVDAMRAGANDYLVKGRLARLPAVVDRELRQASARAARRSLDKTFHALRDVSSAIGRLPDPRALAGLAARHVRELLRVDAAVFHAWDPDAGVLRQVAVDGFAEVPGFVVRPGEGVPGLAFERGILMVAEDEDLVGRPPGARPDVQSVIAAPLIVGARVIGVIVALSLEHRVFSDDDRELIQLLASDVAPSFEAGRLFAEAERHRAEAEALAEAARIVAAGAVARDALRSILTAVQRVVPSSAAGLFGPVDDGARFSLLATSGRFASAAGRSFDSGSSIVGRALRTGAIQIRAEGEPPEELQVLTGETVDVAVPIIPDRAPIAVLGVAAGANRRFRTRDIDLLRRFASLVAMALENARLQRESEGRAAELERLAHVDALTGLPNRALFQERVRDAIAGGGRRAVLHLDIDHFKDVNHAFGAEAGDALLRGAAARLQEALGPHALVARLAGDEFAAMVDDEADDGERAARSAQLAFDRPIAIQDEQASLRVSVGVALHPRDGGDAETLLRHAEVALQAAKHGDGVAVYATERDEYSPERLALMTELRRAIDRDELTLHYQPVVDMRTRRVARVEALVRWQHPERGLLMPAAVIPLVERAGLMKRLTLWVVQEALRQAWRWHDDGIGIGVAVNLPMRTLHDADLPDLVRDLIARTHAEPGWLSFEITESDVMADAVGATRILARLREMGLRVSIDDFGTGYSSLAYLQQLDVHAVKIDRSFVMHSAEESSAAIVRATIELARALGLQVVAEGVEGTEAWDLLASLGCDMAQGYYIARPMRAADVSGWMAEWGRARPR